MLVAQLSALVEAVLLVVGTLALLCIFICLGAMPAIIDLLSRRMSSSFRPQRRFSASNPYGGVISMAEYVEFLWGQRFRVTNADRQVAGWLSALVLERQSDTEPIKRQLSLVKLRHDFRLTISLQPIGGLLCCLRSPNDELRILAVWLLGRCASGAAVNAVKSLSEDSNARIRREVVRAFQRMAEWTELQAMAKDDPDAHVRTQATTLLITTKRPYAARLSRFARHTGGEPFEPGRYSSHMPVFMLHPVGPGTPAKSRDFIRRILEHIRELVRSRFKNHAA